MPPLILFYLGVGSLRLVDFVEGLRDGSYAFWTWGCPHRINRQYGVLFMGVDFSPANYFGSVLSAGLDLNRRTMRTVEKGIFKRTNFILSGIITCPYLLAVVPQMGPIGSGGLKTIGIGLRIFGGPLKCLWPTIRVPNGSAKYLIRNLKLG